MGKPRELPPEIDTTIPSAARAYDYGLGGKNNFDVDRHVIEAMVQKFPGGVDLVFANRRFLQRGVRYLVGAAGITQIIDVGSGLPTAGNVHEIAHEIDPTVRVVYVDIDPIVLAHGRALLADDHTAGERSTTVIQADARDPRSVLDHPQTRDLIDLDRPYAVLLSGILHHLHDDENPAGVTRTFTELMPPGSHLLASSFLNDDDPRATDAERELTALLGTGFFRSWEQQREYFEGLELVSPGLVYANDWRPDSETPTDSPWHTFYVAGIGRKP